MAFCKYCGLPTERSGGYCDICVGKFRDIYAGYRDCDRLTLGGRDTDGDDEEEGEENGN